MKAIYPGSFDPITNGHLDIIKRGSRYFDELIIAVMTNSSKKTLFSVDERLLMISDAVKSFSNVKVVAVERELTVNVALKTGAGVILRGVRDVDDFQFEQRMANMNRRLNKQIDTLLLPCSPENSSVSSSIVKEIAYFHGDISNLLPPKAQLMLEVKINEKENED